MKAKLFQRLEFKLVINCFWFYFVRFKGIFVLIIVSLTQQLLLINTLYIVEFNYNLVAVCKLANHID